MFVGKAVYACSAYLYIILLPDILSLIITDIMICSYLTCFRATYLDHALGARRHAVGIYVALFSACEANYRHSWSPQIVEGGT